MSNQNTSSLPSAAPQLLQTAINVFLQGTKRWEYGQALYHQDPAGYYNKNDGFYNIDCSNRVSQSLIKTGFNIPAESSAAMAKDTANFASVYEPGNPAAYSLFDVQQGDIVCFARPKQATNHVGIVAYFNAASGYGVMVDALGSPSYVMAPNATGKLVSTGVLVDGGRDTSADGLDHTGKTTLTHGPKYSLFRIGGLSDKPADISYQQRLQIAKAEIPPALWAQFNIRTNNFTTLGLYDEPEAVSRIMRPIGAHHPTGIKISAGDAPQLAATNQLLTSVAFDSNLDSKSIEVSYFGQSGAIRIAASSGEYCVIPAGCIDSNTQIVFPNGSAVAFSSLPGVASLNPGSRSPQAAAVSPGTARVMAALAPDTTNFTLAGYLQGLAFRTASICREVGSPLLRQFSAMLPRLLLLICLGPVLPPVHAEIPQELVRHYMSGGDVGDHLFLGTHKDKLFSTSRYPVYAYISADASGSHSGTLDSRDIKVARDLKPAISNLIATTVARAKSPPKNLNDWCAQLITTAQKDKAETFFESIAECVKAFNRPVYSSDAVLVGVNFTIYRSYPSIPHAADEVVVDMGLLFRNFRRARSKSIPTDAVRKYFDVGILAALRPDGSFRLLQYTPSLIFKYE